MNMRVVGTGAIVETEAAVGSLGGGDAIEVNALVGFVILGLAGVLPELAGDQMFDHRDDALVTGDGIGLDHAVKEDEVTADVR
jgi:hypothetical protein